MHNNLDNNVLIVGSVALDTIKTPAGEVDSALGGAAVHSSVAASFFCPVRVVGVVGEDFPSHHLSFLKDRQIDLTGLQITEGKSFRWAGYYEGDLNQANTIATHLNVFEHFRPTLPQSYCDSKFVFLANIDPELQLEVINQVAKPDIIGCDTMNFWIDRKKDALLEVIRRVDIVFLNDSETRQLSGTMNLIQAAQEILAIGPKAIVIKKGEHGALLITGDSIFSAPSYPLDQIIDPTGAGDSFAGGFMGFLANSGDLSEMNMRRAVIYGSTIASYNVQGFSVDRLRDLTHEEISGRYDAFIQISTVDL